jgi:hypothetical protein
MKLNLLYIRNTSYQCVLQYSLVFRMYARYIILTYCAEQRDLPSTPPYLPYSIRIFQAHSIGRVELSLDENVLKCF